MTTATATYSTATATPRWTRVPVPPPPRAASAAGECPRYPSPLTRQSHDVSPVPRQREINRIFTCIKTEINCTGIVQ